jgi:tetratricopeptide (TPR) repeat protein
MLIRMLRFLTVLVLSCSLWPAAAAARGGRWKSCIDAGEKAAARRDYARAEQLFTAALEDASRRGPVDRDVAISLFEMGVVASEQREWRKSEPLYRRALPLFERLLARETAGGRHVRDRIAVGSYADTLEWLGSDCGRQGRYSEAESYFRQALAIQETYLGTTDTPAAHCMRSLAVFLCDEERDTEAEPLWQRALAIFEAREGPHSIDVCTCLNALGTIHLYRDEYAAAEQYIRRALAAAESQKNAGRLDKGLCLQTLGELYRRRNMAAKAEPFHRRALAVLESLPRREDRYLSGALLSLGTDCCDQRKYAKAEALYRRALALRENLLGPDHPQVADCLEFYTDLLKATGRDTEAAEMEARVRAIRLAHPIPGSKLNGSPAGDSRPEQMGPASVPDAGQDGHTTEAVADWASRVAVRGLILLLTGLCIWGVKGSLFYLVKEAVAFRVALLRRNWWKEDGCCDHLVMFGIYLFSAMVLFCLAGMILFAAGGGFFGEPDPNPR